MIKMDEINIVIIRHLRDGRKPFKEIAADLGVSENTVRSRVSKMRSNNILDICGLMDPQAISGLYTIIVGVKLDSMDLINKAEEFSKLRGVVFASVVTGRYDLILVVLLSEEFGLLEFYTQEVSKIEYVQSVESFVVYKSYNMKLPYVL